MKKSFAAALYCALSPVIVAQEPIAGESGAPPVLQDESEALAPSPMEELFLEIVDEARQIELMLNRVTDKETADRSASLLEHMLTRMNSHLHLLEQYSFRHEPEAEALKTNMATLMHISQSYLATMQRLAEVNAYGSDTLLTLFIRYKMDGEKIGHLQAEDMPHTQLYGELADTMEDITYTLKCIQSAADAAAALPRLRKLLRVTDRARHMLAQLIPPSTDEQKDAVRPARARLQGLFGELKKAIDRLQTEQSYGNKELDALLPKLLALSLI